MDNPWDETLRAMREARDLQNAVGKVSNSMAELLRGQLRNVSPYHLAALKKELRDFNIHTGEWRK